MKYDSYVKEHTSTRLIQAARSRLYRNLFSGFNRNGENVLEIGVGACEFALWAREELMRYDGAEPNQALRELAESKGFNIYPAHAPSLEIPGEYKFIYAAHLIEHLNGYGEVMQFLTRCQVLLADHGNLILLYPDIEKCRSIFYEDYTHSYPTTKKRVEDMLKDSGFTIKRSGHYCIAFTNPIFLRFMSMIYPFLPAFKSRLQVCGFTIAGIS